MPDEQRAANAIIINLSVFFLLDTLLNTLRKCVQEDCLCINYTILGFLLFTESISFSILSPLPYQSVKVKRLLLSRNLKCLRGFFLSFTWPTLGQGSVFFLMLITRNCFFVIIFVTMDFVKSDKIWQFFQLPPLREMTRFSTFLRCLLCCCRYYYCCCCWTSGSVRRSYEFSSVRPSVITHPLISSS